MDVIPNTGTVRLLSAAVLAMTITLVLSCGQRGGRKPSPDAEPALATRAFPMVSVPAVLGSADEISEYLADHYFDRFTSAGTCTAYLCDSTHIGGVAKGEVEQNFANYCAVLEKVPLDKARSGMERLWGRLVSCEDADSASNVFEQMVEIVDRYLYDPNSPLRNEDFYQPFVAGKAKYRGYAEVEREGFARTAHNCSLNRVGTTAADFRFSDRNGRIYRLHGIKADRIILFFSNPGCHACAEIIGTMKSYPQMERMIASGELAVLNIYIDEDTADWYRYMPIYPASWYNGYDPDYIIRSENLYDVRAIPSLYLLDGNHTVLMKDAPMEKLFAAVFGE